MFYVALLIITYEISTDALWRSDGISTSHDCLENKALVLFNLLYDSQYLNDVLTNMYSFHKLALFVLNNIEI